MRRTGLLALLAFLVGLVGASSAPAVMRAAPAIRAAGAAKSAPARPAPRVRALALAGNPTALRVLSAPTTMCVGADDPDANTALQESAMGCLVNYARQQAGVGRINDLAKLDGSAANKGGDILRCNQFSHEACGRDFLYWFRRAGYLSGRCWWVGENLAWGTGSLGSARAIMKAWLHSPEHRANLLSTQYSQYGISLRVGSLSGASSAHVWVNHFGRHC